MINQQTYKRYWRKTGLKQKGSGEFFLNHVREKNPKNFLEIGVFHGVTSRNVCDLLYSIHGDDFKFTGIDLFDLNILKDDYAPSFKFSNPLKNFYYNYIIRLNPYSLESVQKLLRKYKNNVNIIKGNSHKILKEITLDNFDYVFLDGGHSYETVIGDLKCLTKVIENNGVIFCDDYDVTNSQGVKKAIDEYILLHKNFNLKILNYRFVEITKNTT